MSVLRRVIDGTIEAFSPQRALQRESARVRLDMVKNYGYSEHGASVTKSTMLSWRAVSASPADDIDRNHDKLRARSRDLYISGSLARGAVDTLVTNIVGPGLMLDSHVDHEALGISREEAAQIERQIEREFALWAENEDCVIARNMSFAQAQHLVVQSAFISGDVFVALAAKERKGRTYDLRLNVLESDRVASPTDGQLNPMIREGVELDEDGAPVAYWVTNSYRHGSIRTVNGALQQEWKRVPAFGRRTGRRNILHIKSGTERPGQVRGVPVLAPVIEDLKQLTRYSEAEVTAAVLSAYFTVFVTSDTPNSPLQPQFRPGQQLKPNPIANPYEMGPGAIVGLREGEKIEIANPGRPNTAFEPFTAGMMRQIGSALGLPYEILIKHFSSSYSASRGAKLEAVKTYAVKQKHVLIDGLCNPVYQEWLAEAVARGRINLPGFFDDPAIRAAWSGARWYGMSEGALDPLKEAKASQLLVAEGFSTRAREAAKLSGDTYENIHAVRVVEENMRRADGLAAPLVTEEASNFTEEEEEA